MTGVGKAQLTNGLMRYVVDADLSRHYLDQEISWARVRQSVHRMSSTLKTSPITWGTDLKSSLNALTSSETQSGCLFQYLSKGDFQFSFLIDLSVRLSVASVN